MMPSPKIFRSRWAALLWAAGVIVTALQMVPLSSASSGNDTAAVATDATGNPVTDDDLRTLANAMGG